MLLACCSGCSSLWRFQQFYASLLHDNATLLLGAFAKLRKATISFVMSLSLSLSIRAHGTTRLPQERFSWKFIFAYFSNNFEKIQIWRDNLVFNMETYVHLWQYIPEFFLDWKLFETKIVGEANTWLFSITFFSRK